MTPGRDDANRSAASAVLSSPGSRAEANSALVLRDEPAASGFMISTPMPRDAASSMSGADSRRLSRLQERSAPSNRPRFQNDARVLRRPRAARRADSAPGRAALLPACPQTCRRGARRALELRRGSSRSQVEKVKIPRARLRKGALHAAGQASAAVGSESGLHFTARHTSSRGTRRSRRAQISPLRPSA